MNMRTATPATNPPHYLVRKLNRRIAEYRKSDGMTRQFALNALFDECLDSEPYCEFSRAFIKQALGLDLS